MKTLTVNPAKYLPPLKTLYGSSQEDQTPVAFYICNYSSVCFYILQAFYATYMLVRLCRKNERSFSLILATSMLLYCSISLGVSFALPQLDFNSDHWNLKDRFYDIVCDELPTSLVFIAHWIIFYEYLEMAVVVPILN